MRPRLGAWLFCAVMTDADTREKWLRVKQALEQAGKTDTHYYRRALAILSGKSDPGPWSDLR